MVSERLEIRGSASDLRFFYEVDDETYASSSQQSDLDLIFKYEDYEFDGAQSFTVKLKHFKNLFHQSDAISHKIESTSSLTFKQILQAVLSFVDYIFPDAGEIQQEARRTRQVPFSHVWTLFRPGDIAYEKRTIPPFHHIYEQCFSIYKVEESVSRYDGTKVLCLSLAEIVYSNSMSDTPGPRMAWTTRHIRQYDGSKDITTEDLGIIPFNMIPTEERISIQARLIQRGRRVLQISSMPFSFWNYNGPYGIVHQVVGQGTMGEARLSSRERQWQKHTHENIVIDVATSTRHYAERFDGRISGLHDVEYDMEEQLPWILPQIDVSDRFAEDGESNSETSLFFCQGYLPGYLLSSRVYAVSLLVSELRQPVWEPWNPLAPAALLMPDMTSWRALVHNFMEGSKGAEVDLGRRQAHGSGLVLALEAPRVVARSMANQISGDLGRPLVVSNPLDGDQSLSEVMKAALRWGAILMVDMRNTPTEQQAAMGTHASLYPSVMLISCNSISELGDYCAGMIDGIVKCSIPLKEQPSALWKLHLSQHFANLLECIPAQQLHDAYALLAQIESRESRIEKVISTAQRLAVVEKAQFSFRHVLLAIKSSVPPDVLRKLEDLLNEGNDRLVK